MKIALFAAFVCLAAALPNARQVQNLDNPSRIPGEFLVVLYAPAVQAQAVQYSNNVAARISAISPKITIVNAFTNLKAPILHIQTSDEKVLSQLYNLDEVEVVESNLYENMIEQCQSQNSGSTIWGLSRSSSRAAPNYSGATYSYSSSGGSGVRVYVLDTSIRITHQDFGGRAVFGANFADSNDGDGNGHGTHCAGTVGGNQYGISKATTLVAVKVLSDLGFGSTTGIINGINWMIADVQSRGIRGVGSMSLGGGANTALDSAVNSAVAAGIPVVVAGGNSNANACNFSPARASEAICVGATDINDALSSFSNWGTCTDILAPGSNVLSASHLSDTGSRSLSGTSMACPHVAGWVATYLSQNPTASPAAVKSALSSNASSGFINLRGTSGTPNLLMYASCA